MTAQSNRPAACPNCRAALTPPTAGTAAESVCPACRQARAVATPATEAGWFYALGGHDLGPFTLAEMQQMRRDGRLQPADPVRTPGAPDRVPASAVRELEAGASGPGVFDRLPLLPAPLRDRLRTLPAPAQRALAAVIAGAMLYAFVSAASWMGQGVAERSGFGREVSFLLGAGLVISLAVLPFAMRRGFTARKEEAAVRRVDEAARGLVEAAKGLLDEGKFEEAGEQARGAVRTAVAAEDFLRASDAAQLAGVADQVRSRHEPALAAFRDALNFADQYARSVEAMAGGKRPTTGALKDVPVVFGDFRRRYARLLDVAAACVDAGPSEQAQRAIGGVNEYKTRLGRELFLHVGVDGGGVQTYSPDYFPDAVVALVRLAQDRLRAGAGAEAEAAVRRALGIRDALFGGDPVGLDLIAPPLAQILLGRGRSDEAARLLARASGTAAG